MIKESNFDHLFRFLVKWSSCTIFNLNRKKVVYFILITIPNSGLPSLLAFCLPGCDAECGLLDINSYLISSKRNEEERAGRKVAHNKLQIIIFTHLMRNKLNVRV